MSLASPLMAFVIVSKSCCEADSVCSGSDGGRTLEKASLTNHDVGREVCVPHIGGLRSRVP